MNAQQPDSHRTTEQDLVLWLRLDPSAIGRPAVSERDLRHVAADEIQRLRSAISEAYDLRDKAEGCYSTALEDIEHLTEEYAKSERLWRSEAVERERLQNILDQAPKQPLEGYQNALARIRDRCRSDPTDMELAVAAIQCAYHIANEALYCSGYSSSTPQGEPALNRAYGSCLPGTREPVVTAPQGNAGESPAHISERPWRGIVAHDPMECPACNVELRGIERSKASHHEVTDASGVTSGGIIAGEPK